MKAVSVLLCLALAHGISASIFKQQVRQVDDLDVQQLEYINQNQRQHRNLPSEHEKKHDQQRTEKSDYQREQQPDQQREQQSRDQQRELQRKQEREQQYKQDREQQYKQEREQQYKQEREQQHKQEREQQRRQERDQHHKQERDQQRKQERDQQGEQQPHTWDSREQLQHPQPQQYQQYQKPAYQHVQHLASSVQQSQEQYDTFKTVQHTHHKQKTQRPSSSSSSESSQSSEESKERRHYYDNKKSGSSDGQKWESPLQVYAMNQKNQMVPTHNDDIEWKALQMAVGPNASVQDKEKIEEIFGDAQKAMKHITEEDKVKFHEAYNLAKQQNIEDGELNATQLAQKYQYPVEEHTIKTDDGYVLTVFRIPPKKHIRDVQKKPVVFLMHGILGSADDWLLMGPEKSLAFLLSDAGYDVWLGNARGNKYSKAHVTKHPALSDFWQYSIDEIALHDLPAMIDYALETTKQEKLYYIGHSQGTTAFFALTATRPEYNDKIIMMYALSPMVYMTNVRSPLFRMIAPTSKFHERLQHQLGHSAFAPNKDLIRTVGGAMLENEIGCKKVSSHVSFVMAGVNVDDANFIPVVMRHLPAGTSTKVIKQYGQTVASDEFRRYDYGPKINEKVYGREQPPKYEMENVQAPVALFYSEEDWLAHPQDVERLGNELPNVREAYKVSDEHFSNMDFQFSTKAPEMVYRQLIESMQNNQ